MSQVPDWVCSYVTTSRYASAWRALTLESLRSVRMLLPTAMLAGSRTLGMPTHVAVRWKTRPMSSCQGVRRAVPPGPQTSSRLGAAITAGCPGPPGSLGVFSVEVSDTEV